jgi:HD-like signal output (HDOD) protein/DNA-binding CsgD family transcriptional regulator
VEPAPSGSRTRAALLDVAPDTIFARDLSRRIMLATATVRKPESGRTRPRGEERSTAQRVRGSRESRDAGSRLAVAAFDSLLSFPALGDARRRLLSAASGESVVGEMVAAVESDIALTIAVLREANSTRNGAGGVETTRDAVELLRPRTIQALASRVGTFDFFELDRGSTAAPVRLRLHALATQRVADRIATAVGYEHRGRLAVTSLLHDVGLLAIPRARLDEHSQGPERATPRERIGHERADQGIDHALIGGLLIRRCGLPGALAEAVERHRDAGAVGEAALIQLADLLARYEQGSRVAPGEMLESAQTLGLDREAIGKLLYAKLLPGARRPGTAQRGGLSAQELRVLQAIDDGLVPKQIAAELVLSVSTVRSHIHNVCRKLDVADRAHAVILAKQHGWLRSA